MYISARPFFFKLIGEVTGSICLELKEIHLQAPAPILSFCLACRRSVDGEFEWLETRVAEYIDTHSANAKMQRLAAQKADFEARVRECEASGTSGSLYKYPRAPCLPSAQHVGDI
jgi:hypothetical protein